ncbi:hypothetical protein PENTCL1PPCAC_6275 [Pristionchus entomophagus]|uniref:Uncharacterized protein n=1 Tax=Pristionchus entomophagus TaxID=358040 RepID=A0AAV5SNF8_9BILA|nr:hypothetical protein PENTCL1PPCAC_6275 [Pristionchus entomophagus]
MVRFVISFIVFFFFFLPFIFAYPNMIYNDEDLSEDNGYRSFNSKRGLVIPSNAMMLRNFPMLRRV